ncbi:hypothetical protein [Paraburkholderia sp. BL21I4N1]|uniref:hypothetical protein n=1 Tax=Paraburkholderia sp. BL21I4N1 TaxID=1938801 RepID=UPI000CFCFAAB|nr:hypothetical protein [Paraburkholderia sp. BL21I4N1]PQV45204.1 hypothetical protein B0G83_118118 [Paraburkholderia sp. BL21I4N1]
MKIQSANDQSYEISQAQAAPSDGPDTELMTKPAVFHTAGHGPSNVANGVAYDDKGQGFIKQDALTLPVRYDKANGTWRVFTPENPTKYQPPVSQDNNGTWQVHGNVGLPGGFKGDLMAAQAAVLRITQLQQRIPQLENRLQQVIALQNAQNVRISACFDRLRAQPPSPAEAERQWREATAGASALTQERVTLQQDLNGLRMELQLLQNQM